MRRYYLPQGNDEIDDLARAIWLDNRYWSNFDIAVSNGIAHAFNGDS